MKFRAIGLIGLLFCLWACDKEEFPLLDKNYAVLLTLDARNRFLHMPPSCAVHSRHGAKSTDSEAALPLQLRLHVKAWCLRAWRHALFDRW